MLCLRNCRDTVCDAPFAACARADGVARFILSLTFSSLLSSYSFFLSSSLLLFILFLFSFLSLLFCYSFFLFSSLSFLSLPKPFQFLLTLFPLSLSPFPTSFLLPLSLSLPHLPSPYPIPDDRKKSARSRPFDPIEAQSAVNECSDTASLCARVADPPQALSGR